jgi:hypothetical protein
MNGKSDIDSSIHNFSSNCSLTISHKSSFSQSSHSSSISSRSSNSFYSSSHSPSHSSSYSSYSSPSISKIYSEKVEKQQKASDFHDEKKNYIKKEKEKRKKKKRKEREEKRKKKEKEKKEYESKPVIYDDTGESKFKYRPDNDKVDNESVRIIPTTFPPYQSSLTSSVPFSSLFSTDLSARSYHPISIQTPLQLQF